MMDGLSSDCDLPGGWLMRVKTRTGGLSRGKVDVYYISPPPDKLIIRSKVGLEDHFGDTLDLTRFVFAKGKFDEAIIADDSAPAKKKGRKSDLPKSAKYPKAATKVLNRRRTEPGRRSKDATEGNMTTGKRGPGRPKTIKVLQTSKPSNPADVVWTEANLPRRPGRPKTVKVMQRSKSGSESLERNLPRRLGRPKPVMIEQSSKSVDASPERNLPRRPGRPKPVKLDQTEKHAVVVASPLVHLPERHLNNMNTKKTTFTAPIPSDRINTLIQRSRRTTKPVYSSNMYETIRTPRRQKKSSNEDARPKLGRPRKSLDLSKSPQVSTASTTRKRKSTGMAVEPTNAGETKSAELVATAQMEIKAKTPPTAPVVAKARTVPTAPAVTKARTPLAVPVVTKARKPPTAPLVITVIRPLAAPVVTNSRTPSYAPVVTKAKASLSVPVVTKARTPPTDPVVIRVITPLATPVVTNSRTPSYAPVVTKASLSDPVVIKAKSAPVVTKTRTLPTGPVVIKARTLPTGPVVIKARTLPTGPVVIKAETPLAVPVNKNCATKASTAQREVCKTVTVIVKQPSWEDLPEKNAGTTNPSCAPRKSLEKSPTFHTSAATAKLRADVRATQMQKSAEMEPAGTVLPKIVAAISSKHGEKCPTKAGTSETSQQQKSDKISQATGSSHDKSKDVARTIGEITPAIKGTSEPESHVAVVQPSDEADSGTVGGRCRSVKHLDDDSQPNASDDKPCSSAKRSRRTDHTPTTAAENNPATTSSLKRWRRVDVSAPDVEQPTELVEKRRKSTVVDSTKTALEISLQHDAAEADGQNKKSSSVYELPWNRMPEDGAELIDQIFKGAKIRNDPRARESILHLHGSVLNTILDRCKRQVAEARKNGVKKDDHPLSEQQMAATLRKTRKNILNIVKPHNFKPVFLRRPRRIKVADLDR